MAAHVPDGRAGGFRSRNARCARRLVLSAILLTLLAAPANADKPLGLDVSTWQGYITPSQWAQIRSSGLVFCFARASYGYGGGDDQFVSNMVNGTAAGVYMGAYHFAYPQYSASNTAVNEADSFVNAAGSYIGVGYLRPVLDFEWNGQNLSRAVLSQWANDWMNRVQQRTGVEPMIYCNTNYAANYLDSSLAGRTLWIANWPSNPNPQTGTPPIGIFNAWAFWQYSDAGSVAGLSPLDLDVFNGTLAQLQSYVVAPQATIRLSPTALSPTIIAGQTAPDGSFTVTNIGGGTLNYSLTVDASWLSVTPVFGASTGEADTITVKFATTLLTIGSYTASIQIAATNATNSPQSVTVTLTVNPVPGDLNRDGSIDQSDVSLFQRCLTGAEKAIADPSCQTADLDEDGDVDMSDFGILQRCLGAPRQRPDPDCGNAIAGTGASP